MKFKSYNSIICLKRYWNLIKLGNDKIYQAYEFNKLFYYYRKTSIHNFKNKNRKTLFIVGFDKNIPCCIAPLGINETNKSVCIIGYGTNAGYLDFIYNEDINILKISELLKECCRLLPEYTFLFTDLKDNSKLFQVLPKDDCADIEGYAITLPDTFEIYYENLSKSTRQNIRTTYNRIIKDSVSYSLKIYKQNGSVNKNLIKKLNYIYLKRRSEWYGMTSNENYKQKSKIKEWQEINRDIIFKSLKKFSNAIIVLIEINNQPAAFMIAYVYNNSIVVPRLAIDTDYSRYSPGGLLLVEYIKQLYDNGYGKGVVIDLCRGNEKYKSVYGGKLSLTHSVKFDASDVMKL